MTLRGQLGPTRKCGQSKTVFPIAYLLRRSQDQRHSLEPRSVGHMHPSMAYKPILNLEDSIQQFLRNSRKLWPALPKDCRQIKRLKNRKGCPQHLTHCHFQVTTTNNKLLLRATDTTHITRKQYYDFKYLWSNHKSAKNTYLTKRTMKKLLLIIPQNLRRRSNQHTNLKAQDERERQRVVYKGVFKQRWGEQWRIRLDYKFNRSLY